MAPYAHGLDGVWIGSTVNSLRLEISNNGTISISAPSFKLSTARSVGLFDIIQWNQCGIPLLGRRGGAERATSAARLLLERGAPAVASTEHWTATLGPGANTHQPRT